MAELIDVAKAMFSDRNKWMYITDDDKVKYSFIFNRYFSKKFPSLSFLNNLKDGNGKIIMDLWFNFVKTKEFKSLVDKGEFWSKWFWSKSLKINKSELENKDFNLLMIKLELNKSEDLIYLVNNYFDIIEEELKYFKKTNK